MGNLYADESLYLSGISPLRPAAGLSSQEIDRLQHGIVDALTAALAIYDEGREEAWPDPPRALHGWTIPRIKDGPCPRCSSPIAATRVRGRGTYYCPGCQR